MEIKNQLKILTFLHFFFLGCFIPIFPLYLKNFLHLSGSQLGLVMSVSALASIVAPFWSSFLADRRISSERFYTLCIFVAAGLIFLFFFQNQFIGILFFYLLYQIALIPTFGLLNTVTFHHLDKAPSDYGKIRVWGTIGWFIVGWIVSFLWLRGPGGVTIEDRIPGVLLLSGALSVLTSIFSLTIPKTMVNPYKKVSLLPREAIAVIKQPELIFFCLISFFIGLSDRFYLLGSSLYLQEQGLNKIWIMPALSIGQVPELFTMGMIGAFILKRGYRKIFLLGGMFKMLQFGLLFIPGFLPITVLGISMQGFGYAFFYGGAFIYLDFKSNTKSRAGVHQFFTIIILGLSSLFGNNLAGWIHDLLPRAEGIADFRFFWTPPLLLSLISFVLLALFFKNPLSEKSEESAS